MNQTNQQLTLAQAMQLAEQQQAAGNIQQAEATLRQILQVQPQHPFALHLLGVIAHQSGNADLATQLIEQAISIAPNHVLFRSNICEMYRQQGKLEQAIAHGEQAIALDISNPSAHSNLGICWYDKGELEKAEVCQKKALEIQPNFIAALNNLGSICRDHKDLDQAEKYYQQVLAIAPQHLESMNNLGAVFTEKEQPEKSIPLIQQALQINPNYADAHHNLAIAQMVLEQEAEAEQSLHRELQLQPNKPEPYLGLGQLYLSQKNLEQAEEYALKAQSLGGKEAEVLTLLADIHVQAGFPEKAEDEYQKALELKPDSESAMLGMGHLQMEQGNMDNARTSFLQALEISPESMAAKLALVQVGKVKADDKYMAMLVQEGESLDSMLETKAMSLHFALGKCYDDIKEPDLAFPHFAKGNALRRKRLEYSAEAHEKHVTDICNIFTKENIERLQGSGNASELPIFVLGMPRSGTTLTEQIIASHPDVHGAGELPDLLHIADSSNTGITYPLNLEHITNVELKNMANQYISGLQERSPEAKRITDKMPANFSLVGLIHLLLPNAKIIHIKRNPVDTCLSNFTKLFGHKSQPQSYNLAELGLYYKNYARLMEHWRKVLPVGAFYEVQYEDLVADNETQARALIDFCELPWNDKCLEFHKNKRIVRTASISQVRQPIYTSSIERWRKYESHLTPLLDALGDLV